jgi:hypothetical protein
MALPPTAGRAVFFFFFFFFIVYRILLLYMSPKEDRAGAKILTLDTGPPAMIH